MSRTALKMGRSWLIRRVGFLPQGERSSGPLIYVLTVMIFMCTITLAGAFTIFNATATWTHEARNDFTVQIVPGTNDGLDGQISSVLETLRATPGIAAAEPLNDSEIAALLEPWIGAGNLTADLPIPALIAAQVEAGASIDYDALQAKLRQLAPGATVDDHQEWLGDVARMAGGLEAIAAVAVVLMLAATVSIVVFGSRARLAAHWDSVEIVHLMGANDAVIRDEFRGYFLEYGLRGGIYGLIGAALFIAPVLYLAGRPQEGLLSMIHLSAWQMVLIGLLPIGAAALAMATAGITVNRVLRRQL